MSAFQRSHSQELEDDAVAAWLDEGIRPARRILDAIKAGKFKSHAAQDVNEHTFRSWVRREEARRGGRTESALAQMPHRDAIELLRRELLGMAHDAMVKEKRRATPDLKRLQDAARLTREAAAIPEKTDPRPAAPGQRDPQTGGKNGSETRGALAAQIEAAHKRSSAQPTATENAGPGHSTQPSTEDEAPVQTDSVPGGQHSERVPALPA